MSAMSLSTSGTPWPVRSRREKCHDVCVVCRGRLDDTSSIPVLNKFDTHTHYPVHTQVSPTRTRWWAPPR